jgi:hypothetical protein
MIRVLICDDHQIVRQGIKQVLADAPDIASGGEAADGPEAMARCAARGGIDVVLLDIAMPQRDGLDVLKQLRSEFPKLPVLMLHLPRPPVRGAQPEAGRGRLPEQERRQRADDRRHPPRGGGAAVHHAPAWPSSWPARWAPGAREDSRCTSGCRTASTRSSACWPGPQRGRDRRAAGAVAQHREHLPRAHPGEDRRAQRRGAGAVRGAVPAGAAPRPRRRRRCAPRRRWLPGASRFRAP